MLHQRLNQFYYWVYILLIVCCNVQSSYVPLGTTKLLVVVGNSHKYMNSSDTAINNSSTEFHKRKSSLIKKNAGYQKPDTFHVQFYLTIVLSIAASFILYKIYRLKVSRIQRNYLGEDGRSTRQFVPLANDDESENEESTIPDNCTNK